MKISPKSTSDTLAHNQKKRDETGSLDVSLQKQGNALAERSSIYNSRERDPSKVFKSSNDNLAIGSKLLADPEKKNQDLDMSKILNEGKEIFAEITKLITCRKENNKNILELFPDISMGISIIISSILSPSKMTDSELNYRFEGDFLLGQEDIRSSIIDLVQKYVDDNYDLAEELNDILHEALALTGACPHLILNEAVVDDVINADLIANFGIEDYKATIDGLIDTFQEPVGFINKITQTEIGLESFQEKENITSDNFVSYLTSASLLTITDNSKILGFNRVSQKVRTALTRQTMRGRVSSVGIETHKEKLQYLSLYRKPESNTEINRDVRILHTKEEATRKGIGRAMVTKVPTEAVAPGRMPGNKDKHLCYFIMLDERGEFITTTSGGKGFDKLNNNLHGELPSSGPLAEVYKDLISGGGGDCISIDKLYDMYKDVVESQILEAYDSATYGDYVEIPNSDDIYYMMFCRALQNQKTSVLYVPKENLVYFSLMNNDAGLGKTLLDDLLVICSIRAQLLFAKLMAYQKQAIKITEVDIQLDPGDPQAAKTIEEVKNSIFEANRSYMTVGDVNPLSIVERISKSGYKFNITGHPAMPDMAISYNNGGLDHSFPSEEFDEYMQKQSIFGIGLRPEIIDDAYSPEFAIQHVTGNSLLVKKFRRYQKAVSPEVSKFVTAIIVNDYKLREMILEEVKKGEAILMDELTEEEKAFKDKSEDDFYEYYLDKLADNIYVELPEIPDTQLSIKKEQLDDYLGQLDEAMDVMFDSDMFDTDVVGETGERLDTIKAAMKATIFRRWAADNNYLPELFKLISEDPETIDTTTNSIDGHLSGVTSLVTNLRDKTSDLRIAVKRDNAVITKKEEDAEAKDAGEDEGESLF